MFNKGQLAGLMKQAQAMQDNLKKAQEELASVEVTGESGAGLVKVTVNGKNETRRVEITVTNSSPECLAMGRKNKTAQRKARRP